MDETNIKIYNPSKNIDDNQISKIYSDFIDLLDKYKFIPNGNINSLKIAIVFNKTFKNINIIKHSNNIFSSSINFPKNISSNQEIQDTIFRANLDYLLKNYKLYENIVNIFIIYNIDFSKIPFLSELEEKDNLSFKNVEGLAYFEPIIPKYYLDKIILNEDLLSEIHKTLIILKQKNIIYEDWGFNEIDPTPKAIINFYGPSGTGKTMTAHAIANYLNVKILALNYAEIESKFVGDAPKNLIRAFESAQKTNSLLFFDEADSFLGKRISNVTSSSDQAVNSLRSQMLILLENFNGIVIFATNLVTNYDKAFESRILKHLKFDLPNRENRKKIIEKMIPSKLPFEHNKKLNLNEIENLANISEGFSGREIKNTILDVLCSVLVNNRMFVNYYDFEISFNKYKSSKDNLKNESKNTVISAEQKKEIEEKIKTQLNTENSLKSN